MRVRGVTHSSLFSNYTFLASVALIVGISMGTALSQSGSSIQSPDAKIAPCVVAKGQAHSCSNPCVSCAETGGATALVVEHPAPAMPPEEKMKSLVPLLQSAIWAILIGAGLVAFREEIAGFLNRANSLNIGPLGISTQPEPMAHPSTAVPENSPARFTLD